MNYNHLSRVSQVTTRSQNSASQAGLGFQTNSKLSEGSMAPGQNVLSEDLSFEDIVTLGLTSTAIIALLSNGDYANDAAADAGGVLVGQLYYNTTNSTLQARIA